MKISTSLFSLSFILIFCSTLGCKKGNSGNETDIYNPNSVKFVSEKISVNTFETITLKTKSTPSEKYNGFFGSIPVVLIKNTDSTIAFLVPEVATGEHTLKFDSSSIKYNVSKTPEMNTDELASTVFKQFDSRISSLSTISPSDSAHINNLKTFKVNVFNHYNTLTAKQKRLTSLFYQANLDRFKAFDDKLSKNLNASIGLRRISECPKTPLKEFGSCIAESFDDLLPDLISTLDEATITLKYKDWLPEDYNLSTVTALWLYFASERTKIWEFKRNVGDYLQMRWVLNENLFDNLVTVFPDETFTDLNIQASFRTLNENDGNIHEYVNRFIENMSSLRTRWSLLEFLPPFPEYQEASEPITLVADITKKEWKISEISKPAIIVADTDGESVKFNNTSNEIVYFSYKIEATRQGFYESKTAYGRVDPVDSIAYYKNLVLGSWLNTWDHDYLNDGNYSFAEEDKISVYAGGSAIWTEARYKDGNVTKPNVDVGWSLYKSGSSYIFRMGAQSGRITPTQLSFISYPASRYKLVTHKE